MDFKDDPIAKEVEPIMAKLKYEKKCEFNTRTYNRVFSAVYDLLKKQIEDPELAYLREVKKEYESVIPRLDFFNENRGYLSTMPFIPQDFDFEHTPVEKTNMPTMDVFHKEGWAITKMGSGKWLFSKRSAAEKFDAEFDIKNAFVAFMILKALNISVPEIKIEEE